MSKKIRKTQLARGQTFGIKAIPVRPEGLSFSFKYYQQQHPRFTVIGQPLAYWQTLLTRLKDLSGLSAQELLANRSRALRCHPIRWEETCEDRFGLPNEEQLVDTPYQFSLSSNAHGRVHGFLIDQIFYVVWLDPEHSLYPGKA